jgi:hypothetical protein
MGIVRKIGDAHHRKVGAALEILVAKHRAGRLPSLLFIGEELGSDQPLYGMVGLFRARPTSAIGHVAVFKRKLVALAAEDAPDFEEPA